MSAIDARPVPPLTVFYDGACRLCSAEIGNLRGLVSADRVVFADCAAPDFDDTAYRAEGVGREAMLQRMHVRDDGGAWLSGPDAFEALYLEAGLGSLARAWVHPMLRPANEILYAFVVRHRLLLSRLGAHHLVDALWRRIAARLARRQAAAARCESPGSCAVGRPYR